MSRINKNALVVMAKSPKTDVKTRLAKDISGVKAKKLYRSFLSDVALIIERLVDVDIYIYYSPSADEDLMKAIFSNQNNFIPQQEGDLGFRMAMGFERLFNRGYERVVLIGSDIPHLSIPYLERSFDNLAEGSVVLGPTRDGGYCLIGMTSIYKALFEGIDWGSGKVFEQTVEQVNKLGLTVIVLPEKYDIDSIADLEHLIRDLKASKLDRNLAIETRKCLEQMGMV